MAGEQQGEHWLTMTMVLALDALVCDWGEDCEGIKITGRNRWSIGMSNGRRAARRTLVDYDYGASIRCTCV